MSLWQSTTRIPNIVCYGRFTMQRTMPEAEKNLCKVYALDGIPVL